MSSIKQQQANRLNAQKSTGPRTLRGKAVSRFNALKTGVDAESQIIPGEDPVAFARLAEEYQQRWDPALPEELVLVDTLAHDDWQLRRLRKAEAVHWRYRLEKDPYSSRKIQYWNGGGGNDFARLQRRMDSTLRSFRLTLEKLESLAESGADLPVCPRPAPAPVEELPDLYEPETPRDQPAPAEELPDLYEPAAPPNRRPPAQELPDLYEPISPRNQPFRRGIGFVPSTPSATPLTECRGRMERCNALPGDRSAATSVTRTGTGKSAYDRQPPYSPRIGLRLG